MLAILSSGVFARTPGPEANPNLNMGNIVMKLRRSANHMKYHYLKFEILSLILN